MGIQINGTTDTISAVDGSLDINQNATFSGNVSVGGTLTYSDVTNIDSVGLVTAKNGLRIHAGGIDLTSGISTFSDNIQIADKIIHKDDTNTAIRFPDADTFAVETAGSERVRVSSAGRVGINTTTPTDLLTIVHSANTDDGISIVNTNNSQASAIAQLELSAGDNSHARVQFECNGKYSTIRHDGNGNLDFYTNGSNKRLCLDSSGRLLFGTDSSTRETSLVIRGNSNSYTTNPGVIDLFVGNTPSNLGSMGQICFGTQDKIGARIDGRADQDWTLNSARGTHIRFLTVANGSTTLDERMRITNAGIIQCGTSGVLKAEINNAVSGHQFISQCSDNNNGFEIYQQHGSTSTRNTLAVYDNRGNSGAKLQSFAVRGDGVVLMQATSSSGSSDDNIGFTHVVHGTSPYIRIRHQASNSTGHTIFHMLGASGNLLGEIKQDGSGGVTYHSASDYRLKENVVDLTGAITRIKNLKPKRFNFKVNTDVTQDGFLAHELQEVVPIAVSGTKDEVVTDDSKSKIPTLADKDIGDPVYQTVDTSRVVPLLTAALQEAIAEIETLKTKVAALESS